MMREASESIALDAAIQRLDRALGLLELRVISLINQADTGTGELFDLDRAHLASQLDAARGRERELEMAGAEASAVLGQAIAQIRAALDDDPARQDEDEAGLEPDPARAGDAGEDD